MLKKLGPAARTAVKPVAEMLETAVKNEEAQRAGLLFSVLETMGPDGVSAVEPHILTGLAARTEPMLLIVAARVKMLGPEGRAKAVPILVGIAEKHDGRRGLLALQALAQLGGSAKSASDALMSTLRARLKPVPLTVERERFVRALTSTLTAFDRGLGTAAAAEVRAAIENAQKEAKP
jgi:hypothetical protein